MPEDSIRAAKQLHDATTLFHAFIYFSEEAAAEYQAHGLSGQAGYFASRTAAMGPLATEMIIATFYNFSPDIVTASMGGVWDGVSAEDMQLARWRGAAQVLDEHVRPVMPPDQVAEATALAAAAVDGLPWAGRPLAAGNAAALAMLDASEFGDHDLVKLWQLVTILREWRGDAHIGLLVAEPLDAAECTVVSAAIAGPIAKGIKMSRAWSDADWSAATERLTARGWLDSDGAVTDTGRSARGTIEHRTNELSVALFDRIDVEGADRLSELLAPANKALLAANFFARIGLPAR